MFNDKKILRKTICELSNVAFVLSNGVLNFINSLTLV